jgi:hypothetical protein
VSHRFPGCNNFAVALGPRRPYSTLHALAVLVVDTLAGPVKSPNRQANITMQSEVKHNNTELAREQSQANQSVSRAEQSQHQQHRLAHPEAPLSWIFENTHLSGKRVGSAPAGVGVNMEAPYWNMGPSPERSGKREASKPVGAGW